MFVNLCPLLILVNIYVLLTLRSVSSCKSVRPVDFSNPMCTVDDLRLVCPVNFSKSVRPVDALKLVLLISIKLYVLLILINLNLYVLLILVILCFCRYC